MQEHEKLNYLEFPSTNLSASKDFFSTVFGWEFEDYGPEYTAFSNQGLDGGIFKGPKGSRTENGAALVIFYSKDLEQTLDKIKKAGGEINMETFSYPGGRRFHFIEPGGNEFSVWSEDPDNNNE